MLAGAQYATAVTVVSWLPVPIPGCSNSDTSKPGLGLLDRHGAGDLAVGGALDVAAADHLRVAGAKGVDCYLSICLERPGLDHLDDVRRDQRAAQMGYTLAVVLVRVVQVVQFALEVVQPAVELLDGPTKHGHSACRRRHAGRRV
jgi:hypothetical protein